MTFRFGPGKALFATVSLGLVVASWSAQAPAQGVAAGRIKGRVIHAESGRPVAGAAVSVAGAPAVQTDLDGAYELTGVAAGAVALAISKDGFQSQSITAVQVVAGEVTSLDAPLAPAAASVIKMEAFTVSAEIVQSSDVGLLAARQKSAAVSDAIGSEQFGRLAVGDAAEAMGKVTGASVVDGKYVFIRGLGDRYANTLLNNVSVPSADPDKRAVQMDQFPADLIESIVTTKSFTPDQPGAFSGGAVNIRTKSFPEQFFVSASASTDYNTETTGETLLAARTSGRSAPTVPATLPSRTAAELAARTGNLTTAQTLDAATKSFGTESLFPTTVKADPDFGFSTAIGNRHHFGTEGLFGYTASLTLDRSFSHVADGEANRFLGTSSAPQSRLLLTRDRTLLSVDPKTTAATTPAFGVTSSTQSESMGGFVKLAVRPTPQHEVSLDLFYNESTDDNVRRGVGEEAMNYAGAVFEVYDLLYTERAVASAQLAGKSHFPQANDLRVEWRLATSASTQDQPDYRTLAAVYNPDGSFINATGVQPNRYFRELDEDSVEGGVDVSFPFEAAAREHQVKVGAVASANERTYDEKRFQYSLLPRSRAELEAYPGNLGIVSSTATSVTLGNTITRLQEPNNYDGEQKIAAAYGMLEYQASPRVRVIGGVRFEQTKISTDPVVLTGLTPKRGEIDQTDALPALSVVFAGTPKTNWRAAYGRTIARPTYKELTDIRYEDVFTGDVYIGNPGLELTVVDNVDLRWEWFPRKGETLAVSAFYKRFDQPIEVLYDPTLGSIQPQNVERGTVYGLEFEFRRGLGAFTEVLRDFSLGANLALIHSEVTIPQAELTILRADDRGASDKRELLGQSPYVLNLDATWDRRSSGTTATLSFNVVGERLDLVNFGPLPDVYEQPAPLLNLVVSQRLADRWRLKLSARNLLDPDQEKTIGVAERTLVYARSRTGRTFGVSLTWLFD